MNIINSILQRLGIGTEYVRGPQGPAGPMGMTGVPGIPGMPYIKVDEDQRKRIHTDKLPVGFTIYYLPDSEYQYWNGEAWEAVNYYRLAGMDIKPISIPGLENIDY